MFPPRLTAVVTALVLLGSTGSGRAEYSLTQLQAIESLISSRNCEGLWLFVKSNPTLMVGTDPLASELRTFVAATERGQLECFASRSAGSASPAATAAAPAAVPTPPAPVNELY